MSNQVYPSQTYHLDASFILGERDYQHLITLYQPIIGYDGLSIYLTLYYNQQFQLNKRHHFDLLKQLNIGIEQYNEARLKLEATGLLSTYIQSNSPQPTRYQSIRYILKQPLDFSAFNQSSPLKTLLNHYVGQEYYQQMQEIYQSKAISLDDYTNITQSFAAQFQLSEALPKDSHQNSSPKEHLDDPLLVNSEHSLNMSLIFKALMNIEVDHRIFTHQFKETMQSLHQLYQYSEEILSNLVIESLNDQKTALDYTRLLSLARDYNYKHRQPEFSEQNQVRPESDATSTSFPIRYSITSIEERIKELKEKYTSLQEEDIQLILSMEQIPYDIFLTRIKKDKGGFATQYELRNIEQIRRQVTFQPAVINFLIYYILVILNKTTLYMNDMERYANEWLQSGLDDVPDVILYIRRQALVRDKKKTHTKRNYKRQEPIPNWMKKTNEALPAENLSSEVEWDEEKERQLQAQLQQLLGEEEADG